MYEKAIEERHSTRAYSAEPIGPGERTALRGLLDEMNARHGLEMRLVTDEPDAFGRSIMARFGRFRGVRNYIVMAGPDTAAARIATGYCGEEAVLQATMAGLDTCWVGLTYSRRRVAATVPGSKVHAVITVGHGTSRRGHHKIKSPREVAPGYDAAPEWFRRGVDMALLAPTSLNRQGFEFRHAGGRDVEVRIKPGAYALIDAGIVMRHFEIGAMPEKPVFLTDRLI